MSERLTEFAWIDGNKALHLDIPALLKKMGAPDNDENRKLATQWAVEYLHKHCTGTLCVVTEEPGVMP